VRGCPKGNTGEFHAHTFCQAGHRRNDVLGAQTVQAQTAPSDPCAGASAGACTAGTLSEPIELMRPVPLRTSAFIAQIGDNNTATISQNGSQQFARIGQNGDNGTARVTQEGAGTAYLEIDQAVCSQLHFQTECQRRRRQYRGRGPAGRGQCDLLDQSATAGSVNTAMLAQQGSGNQMQLGQNGSDNRAELVQLGDNNAMTATQNGTANQLRWVQNGNGLSDLQIVQSGNQTMSITQSNGGT
jgi:hypothetical protein